MQTSDSLAKISPALVAALAEIEAATKNAKNPHFRSTYADLTAVLDAVRPVLAKHGLCVMQAPGWNDGRLTLTTRILHTSGEWMESCAETPIGKQDPQGVGSAITYLRRYSLSAVCGVTQEDDDGNAAARKPNRPKSANVEAARQLLQRAMAILERADDTSEVRTLAKYTSALEAAIESGDDGRCAKGISATLPLVEAIEQLDLADA